MTRDWRFDLLAGISVAVVALPLALGFGIASGLGAGAGLVTAVVAGIVAGVFGGSNFQVSGPTGAMTVVLAPIVARYDASTVLVVTLAAGLLLVVAAALKMGRFVAYLPWPVIEGFTVGIGAIIFLQQVPAALGVTPADIDNTALRAVDAMLNVAAGNWQAVAVCAFTAAVMLVLPRLHRTLPAALVAVAAATFGTSVLGLNVAQIGSIADTLAAPALPHVNFSDLAPLASAIFAVATLAAIESLLSAEVADGMADTEHRHDPDRELAGQGVASVASALFGGMPATGAIARTAVNVRAGARTRMATIIHALTLLVFVVALAPVISAIPLAALSAVLMVTAVHMVEFGKVTRLARSTRGDAVVMVATALATVAFDLIVAVEVGVVLAGVLALRNFANASTYDRDDLDDVEIDPDLEHELLQHHIVAYRLDGSLFFAAAQRFLLELAQVTDVDVVLLRCRGLQVLDATGAQALGDLIARLEHRGIRVILSCLRPDHRQLLENVGALDAHGQGAEVVATARDALGVIPRLGSESQIQARKAGGVIPGV